MPQITIKALDDWTLEVLGIPYGGPNNGKDAHGEFFDADTNLHEDKFGLPPVVYYHGLSDGGIPDGAPEYIGRAVSSDRRHDGMWYQVILDKTNEFARRVWEAAKEGLARASSGSIQHLIRVGDEGHIDEWPVGELSVFDTGNGKQPANGYAVALPVMKSVYKQAGISLPEELENAPKAPGGAAAFPTNREDEPKAPGGAVIQPDIRVKIHKENLMSDQENQAQLDAAKAEGRAELEAELTAKQEHEDEIKTAGKDAVKVYQEQQEEEAKKAEEAAKEAEKEAATKRRLPDYQEKDVQFNEMPELAKYDHLNADDHAFMIGVLNESSRKGLGTKAPEASYKALAYKIMEDKTHDGVLGRQAMKIAGIKADEIQQSDLASFGDEWVGVFHSDRLWASIRDGTFVAQRIPSIEVPPGHESVVIPLESGDPTWRKVSQASDTATSGWPNTTITSSQIGTANKTLTLSKMGARVLWSGELEEDSIVPFVSQLRQQLVVSGAEQLEHAIIDGDTATTASTNINDIASTGAQGGTELYLMFNGFRKSPLVTTVANSRSGGALTSEDFLETLKLMGAAGINSLDINKTSFIQDANVRWKSLELADVKTQDVFSGATLEDGRLVRIWGYDVDTSQNMHFKSANRKANSSGKVDQDTTSNNSFGSLLAVRWDQWMMGFRRRMTMETTRIARADTTEIVALARLGWIQRDTEASAITYNITV